MYALFRLWTTNAKMLENINCLRACEVPDVLREFTGRNENLSDADIVVGDHDDLEQVSNVRVIVDGCGHVCDELHNSLGLPVGRKRFSTEHHHSRYVLRGSLLCCHLLHLLVPVNHAHDIQQLPLVLVDTLHLLSSKNQFY